MASIRDTLKAIRRRPSGGPADNAKAIRLSGTRVDTESRFVRSPSDGPLESSAGAIGRTGNEWVYPDTRGAFQLNQDPGDRLQDFANTHLSEGPNPGRIPRPWSNLTHGKLGRHVTGQEGGSIGFESTSSGQSGMSGGIGDMMYVPHTPVPRNQVVARPFLRTVDDAAMVPAVYVADPTRR